jgi:PQQ-dependent dehydrogenase (methanol/ethanol family)
VHSQAFKALGPGLRRDDGEEKGLFEVSQSDWNLEILSRMALGKVGKKGRCLPAQETEGNKAMRIHTKSIHAALLVALAALSGCSDKAAPIAEPVAAVAPTPQSFANVDQKRLEAADSDPSNWMTHGGTYDERRYSALDQIKANDIGRLSLAWSYEFDTNRGQEATPIVVDGVMYVSSAWSKVFALDAASGKLLWKYDPQVIGAKAVHACCDVVNRGVAVWKGKVYVGTLDGRLIALDAKTGKSVWSVVTVDQQQAYTITGAPRVFKDKVIIGNGGAEFGVRGYVTAYDAETGAQAWRFYTVPGDPSKGPDGAASDEVLARLGTPSWAGQWWKYGGGGTVWDSIVYDPELDQLYLGVGNGAPWNHRIRSDGKGDNLFLSSIVALNPDSGKYLWHYQGTPAESWDFTHTQQITLATLPVDGQPRKVLMQAPKNGFFYVLDRKTGELLSAKNFVPVNWASGIDMKTGRPIENPAARYADEPFLALPSAVGAHAWQPMAYSLQTGLVYIPAMELPFVYDNMKTMDYHAGRWNTGVTWGSVSKDLPTDPDERAKALRAMTKGRLIAWDPIAQKEVWRHEYKDVYWNGGVLATAGNLVFQGSADNQFQAFRADNGEKLWSFDAHTGVMAGPISYAVDGKQYVAVLSGYGGSQGIARPAFGKPRVMPNGRVLVFALDGKGKLPDYEPQPLLPANPPDDAFAPADVAAGQKLYGQYCGICHRGSIVPDLRRSPMLRFPDIWRQIVIDGQREQRGMAAFKDYITPEQAEQIRAYIAQESRTLKTQESATEAKP